MIFDKIDESVIIISIRIVLAALFSSSFHQVTCIIFLILVVLNFILVFLIFILTIKWRIQCLIGQVFLWISFVEVGLALFLLVDGDSLLYFFFFVEYSLWCFFNVYYSLNNLLNFLFNNFLNSNRYFYFLDSFDEDRLLFFDWDIF